ncbi:MAG: hypothetical protein QMB92_06415 [Thiopseudomonas sp.]
MMKKMLVLSMALTMSACSVMQPKTSEEQVLSRAEQRMAALKALDFDKAYKFMSPGYRATNSLAVFKADFSGAVNMLSYEVIRSGCPEEDVCQVVVKTQYTISGLGTPYSDEQKFVIDPVATQKWILVDGKWWYVRAD